MPRGNGGKDRTPPTITITSPFSGAVILPNTQFTVTAIASDNKDVARVTFEFNGVLIADTSTPYSATFTTPNVSNYNGLLVARAIDSAGNSATHAISILVSSSTTTTTTTIYVAPPTLPASKILATPSAWNQGGEGSCLSCAAALVASIEKYYTTGATSYSNYTNVLSPEYVYNNCKVAASCGSGSAILSVSSFLISNGSCRWYLCPYDYNNGCDTAGFTTQMADDAALNKITGASTIPTTDFYTMKRAICNNHALIVQFQMDYNFYYAGTDVGISPCNYIWNSRGTLMASHGVAIVGYDDTKQAWLIQNSWGTNWACNGRIWVDYDFLTTITGGVYVYTSRPDKNYYPIV